MSMTETTHRAVFPPTVDSEPVAMARDMLRRFGLEVLGTITETPEWQLNRPRFRTDDWGEHTTVGLRRRGSGITATIELLKPDSQNPTANMLESFAVHVAKSDDPIGHNLPTHNAGFDLVVRDVDRAEFPPGSLPVVPVDRVVPDGLRYSGPQTPTSLQGMMIAIQADFPGFLS